MFERIPKIMLLFLLVLLFTCPAQSFAASEEKIKMILASSGEPSDNFAHETFTKFMELVEEKAPGVFDIQYRPSMQMGDEAETVRLCQSGAIQMATLLSNTMASFAPSVAWMNMPYFFETREDFHKAALGLWDKTNELAIAESGCRIILINEIGFRNLTTSAQKPVKNLAEAGKIKIRLPASSLGLALYQSLGLTPLPINFAETFGALAQGVVDGQEAAYAIVTLKKFYEVQKYALDIETGIHAGFIVASEKWLQSLTPTQRQAILDAGREASIYEFNVIAPKFLERDRKTMEEAGMIFLGQPEDIEKWRELGRQVWPTAYQIIGNGDAQKGETLVKEAAGFFKK